MTYVPMYQCPRPTTHFCLSEMSAVNGLQTSPKSIFKGFRGHIPGLTRATAGGGRPTCLRPLCAARINNFITQRGVSLKRPYDLRRWRGSGGRPGIRELQLQREPLCRMCRSLGNIMTAAVDVDHVQAIEKGGDPWDESNLQSLCHSHHSQKTRQVDQLGRKTVSTTIKGVDPETGIPFEGWWSE